MTGDEAQTNTMSTPGGSSTMRSTLLIRKHAYTGSQSIGLVGMSNSQNTTTVTANAPPDLDAKCQHSRAQITKHKDLCCGRFNQ